MKKVGFVFLAGLFLSIPIFSYGQSDLFEIRTPNTLIIFDTSSSMNRDPLGQAVGPGSAVGVDGVSRTYDGDGNHPNSKLFIAKNALNKVIKDLENVNLGFATYGQLKTDTVRGYYYRNRKDYTAPTSDQWRWSKLYWRFSNYRHSYTKVEFTKDSFTDAWGNLRSGVTVGYTFMISHIFSNSLNNNNSTIPPFLLPGVSPGTYTGMLRYTVNSIVYSPEYNTYTYSYDSDFHDHYEEYTRNLSFPNSNPIDCNVQFGTTWGTWRTFVSADSDQIANPGKWACTGPTLIGGAAGGFGSWYREYAPWLQFSATGCPAVYGSEQNPAENPGQHRWSQWFLVDPADLLIPNAYVKATQKSCYDYSSYAYPADGSTNKPHTWSYFRSTEGFWPGATQPSPYYPATSGSPGAQDNHFFFVNFPEVDDSLNSYQTREKIKTWLDLAPVQSPESGRYHTKLPLKADSVTSNSVDSSYTPLADALDLGKKYFSDYIFNYKGGDAPTKANCRRNYIILFTDGLESARCQLGPCNPPLNTKGDPDYAAAATKAKELFQLVKDKEGNSAGVRTFVIGFGMGLGDKKDKLDDIARNGGTEHKNKTTGSTEYAYTAGNAGELTEAFKDIFEAIKDNYSRSNPVVARDRKSIYRGYLSFPGWNGHLLRYEADKIDATKTIFRYEDRTWDAGQIMNTDGRGEINTWREDKFEPSEVVFVSSNGAALKDYLNRTPEADINGDSKKDAADAETIINFILDSGFDGAKYKGARSGSWKLGDIYHSTPVVVGPPSMNFRDDLFPKKYSKYKEDNKNRATLVYVGANDGMLHGIGEDGKEKFAVIPKNLMGTLRDLRTDHQFFVDSSPRGYDIYFAGKAEWKTVLISGQRGGGNYYFALDVTNPNNPNILWEQSDSKMGYTWSRPEIGRVKIEGKEKFVAFVGGGYSDPGIEDLGNAFYVIDIEEGDASKRILRRFDVGDKLNKIPAGATAFDGNFDGRVDGVYFGDVKGTLWKIKIDGEEDVTKWQLVRLFDSDGALPIYYPPSVTKNNQDKVLVYFGQGDEMNLFEKVNTNFFYEIWDKGTAGEKVWSERLRPGEKVLSSPLVDNNTVYFTTWEYTGIEGECGKGLGRLYGLTTTRIGKTGGEAGLSLLDTGNNTWKSPVKSIELGKGIPSAPVILIRDKRQWIAYSSSIESDNVKLIGPVPGGGKARLKSWREVF
jgi:hypothetical protein